MEDEDEDTPLPFTANQLEPADTRRENMPLIQTTPRFRNSGSVPNAASPLHRSLHGAVGLGLLSTPSGASDDSQALLHSKHTHSATFLASSPNANVLQAHELLGSGSRLLLLSLAVWDAAEGSDTGWGLFLCEVVCMG